MHPEESRSCGWMRNEVHDDKRDVVGMDWDPGNSCRTLLRESSCLAVNGTLVLRHSRQYRIVEGDSVVNEV